eukprot:155654-Heterocapsa_arctica.AAC.1
MVCKYKLSSTRGKPLLKEVDHVFARQGEELLQWSATEQQAHWQVASMLRKVVKPIQHYMAKLGVDPATLGLISSPGIKQAEPSLDGDGASAGHSSGN